jgi:methylphosphotriester-DNA--protein-cysteine methyltransferase
MTHNNVVEMWAWHEHRANARATEARAHHRANPDSADAEAYAYDTMAAYVRAARQRNDADRRRRAVVAQALANELRRGDRHGP